MENLILEIKELIITTLDLEDTSTDEIETEAPLFVEGLGLDSIDALEIGVALQKKYEIKLSSKSDDLKEHFYSVETIAKFVKAELDVQK